MALGAREKPGLFPGSRRARPLPHPHLGRRAARIDIWWISLAWRPPTQKPRGCVVAGSQATMQRRCSKPSSWRTPFQRKADAHTAARVRAVPGVAFSPPSSPAFARLQICGPHAAGTAARSRRPAGPDLVSGKSSCWVHTRGKVLAASFWLGAACAQAMPHQSGAHAVAAAAAPAVSSRCHATPAALPHR